jgi:hypothetical protein
LSLIKSVEERRISFSDLGVSMQTDIDPTADPIAVMQIRVADIAVTNLSLVVAAA